MKLIDVTADNVDETGFFCLMSRKGAPGYERKLKWLKKRFSEGMKLRMLGEGARGFVEYLPGEHAWRPVEAAGYFFIHCLWVVGKSKGKGYGRKLLDACVSDAKKSGAKGVAMVTSEKVWLPRRKLLERAGFKQVDSAEPAFSLMVRKFGRAPDPAFTGDWEKKTARFGKGLTVVRTDQCPYIEDGTEILLNAARKRGLKARSVELKSAQEVRRRSPTPYGTFAVVLDRELLSYHYLTEREFIKRLESR